MFLFYIKKILRCPATLAAIIVLTASTVFGCRPYPYADLVYLHQYSLALGIAGFFIPVVTVIPTCYIRRELREKNAEMFALVRGTPTRWSLGGLFASSCSGAIIMAASFLFSALIFCLTKEGPVSLKTYLRTNEALLGNSGPLIFLSDFFLYAINGLIWPALAYCTSVFSKNQYICAAFPMIFKVFCGYSAQILKLLYLDPGQLFLEGAAANSLWGGYPYVALYTISIITLCAVFSAFGMQRRLKNG